MSPHLLHLYSFLTSQGLALCPCTSGNLLCRLQAVLSALFPAYMVLFSSNWLLLPYREHNFKDKFNVSYIFVCLPGLQRKSQIRCINIYFLIIESHSQTKEQSKLILPLISLVQTLNKNRWSILFMPDTLLGNKGTMISPIELIFQ